MPFAKVIEGDETGMIGDIVKINGNIVTIKVPADNDNLYKFEKNKLVVKFKDVDEVSKFIEEDIVRRMEEEGTFSLYENRILQPSDL